MSVVSKTLRSFSRAIAPKQQAFRCPSFGNDRPHASSLGAVRTYIHWKRAEPEDLELPIDTMPKNMGEVMNKDPKKMDFFESYWYWRVRSEASLLDTENLATKSYKQLARDMGMPIVTAYTEHYIGLIELYEYLKSSPFVGPFGTIENPVIVPSLTSERYAGCTGGTGDNEHIPLFFRMREGFLYRCAECDQIFMLVRAMPDFDEAYAKAAQPEDPDVLDVFDRSLLDKGQRRFNCEHVQWPAGNEVYNQLFMEGAWGNEVPTLTPEAPQLEPLKDHQT